MANKVVAEIILQAKLDPTEIKKESKKLKKMLEVSGAFKIDKEFVDGINNATKGAANAFNEILAKGVTQAGLGPGFKKRMEAGAGQLRSGMIDAAEKVSSIYKKIKDVEAEYAKEIARHQEEGQKEQLRKEAVARINGLKKEAQAHEKRLRENEQQFKKEIHHEDRKVKRAIRGVKEQEELRTKYVDFMSERLGTRLQIGAEKFGTTVDSLLQESFDPRNFANFFQGFGKGLRSAAEGMKAAGAARGGVGGVTQAGIGKLVGGVGKLVGVLGGVVAGFSALVGIILKADAQMAEFNKTILEGGSALDLQVENWWETSTALNTLAEAAHDFNNNMRWRTLAKEQAAIIAGFNQAGYTIREMVEGIKSAKEQVKKFQEATSTALTYAYLLGESAPKIAADMATAMEDFGLSLKGVRERFAAISEGARQSGFSTKDFYSKVLEITSGMTLYNIRLEEAAGLLMRVGKILGKRAGADFLKSIAGAMKGEGIEERIKRVMLTGQDKMKAIFETTAKNTALDFANKLATSVDPEKTRTALSDAFKQVGVTGVDIPGIEDLKKSGTARSQFAKTMIKTLQGLSPAKQEELMARVAVNNQDLARQMRTLIESSQGAKGGVLNMAKNLDALDLGGKLAAEINRMSVMFGDDMSKWGVAQIAAFTKNTGVSMEQFRQLKMVSGRLKANFGILEQQRKRMEELAAQKGGTNTPEYKNLVAAQQQQAASMGAMVTKNEKGQYIIAKAQKDASGTFKGMTDRQIKNTREFIQSQGDTLKKAAEKGAPAHVKYAQTTAAKTTELTKIMKIGVEGLLQKIFGVVQRILAWFGVTESKEEKRAKSGAVAVLSKRMEESMKARQKINETISNLATKLKGAKTDKDIAFYKAEIKKAEDLLKAETTRFQTAEKAMDKLQSMGKTGITTVKGMVGLATGTAAKELEKKGVKQADIKTGFGRAQYETTKQEATREAKRGVGAARETWHGMKLMGMYLGTKLGITNEKSFKKALKEGPELTPKEQLSIEAQAREAAQVKDRKIRAEQAKYRMKEYVKERKKDEEKLIPKRAEANAEAMEKKKREQVAKYMGLTGGAAEDYVRTGQLTDEIKQILAGQKGAAIRQSAAGGGGVMKMLPQEIAWYMFKQAGATPPTPKKTGEDFLLRMNNAGQLSVLQKFSAADNLALAGTKPGGGLVTAANEAMRAGAPGAPGPRAPVQINITINGNEEKAYQVVRKALQTAGVA